MRTSKTPTTTPVSRQKRSKKESEREIRNTNRDSDPSDIIDVTPHSQTLLESPCKYSSCFENCLQNYKKTLNSIATDYEPPTKVRRSIRNQNEQIVKSKTTNRQKIDK